MNPHHNANNKYNKRNKHAIAIANNKNEEITTSDKYNIVLKLQNYMFSKPFFEKHFIACGGIDIKHKHKDNQKDKNNPEKDKKKEKDAKIVNNFFTQPKMILYFGVSIL